MLRTVVIDFTDIDQDIFLYPVLLKGYKCLLSWKGDGTAISKIHMSGGLFYVTRPELLKSCAGRRKKMLRVYWVVLNGKVKHSDNIGSQRKTAMINAASCEVARTLQEYKNPVLQIK